MYSIIVIGSLLLFVVSEKSFIHFSRTARRAFWYVLSCAIFLWVVKWLQELEGLGMAWIMLTAVIAASVVEDEYLKKTGLTPMDIEATRVIRQKYRSPSGQGHSERIMDIVNAITRGKGYTAGTKQLVSRVSGATRKLQRGLHRIIQSVGKEELNFILCSINVPAMIEVAHTKTMKLLVGGRLKDLETVSRAAIVDGLQKIGLRYRHQRQEWAKQIILQTYGVHLTFFKAYIDDGGDYHSMYKLLYNDLQGDVHKEVLNHIHVQAEAAMEAFHQADQSGSRTPGIVLKILSDVDDTVFSSGGSFPAGLDSRYPRKSYYPGALALYAAMDRHFAKKHQASLEVLKSLASGDSPTKSKVPSNIQKLHPSNLPKLKTSTPLKIPSLQVSNKNDESHSPLPGTSPEFYILGDLMTPRDSVNFSAFSGLNRSHNNASSNRKNNPHQEGSNLVLLSARPESYKGLTESESYRKYFQPLVERGDLDTSPTMLLGSLDSGPRALFKLFFGSSSDPEHLKSKTATDALYQTLAAKKLSRFNEYAALYPEAAYVYVGDNGQGDVLCAEALTNNMVYNPRIIASFIHKVAPTMSTLSMFRKEENRSQDIIRSWKMRGIHLHQTHLGMAKAALDLDLISIDDVRKIGMSAVYEFERISSRYCGRHAGRHLPRAAKDLNSDIDSINSSLPETDRIPYVKITSGEEAQTFPGDMVSKQSSMEHDVILE